jgi:hypothetical protein
MDLFEAAQLEPVSVLENPSVEDFRQILSGRRTPVLIKGGGRSWPFVEKWDLDYLSSRVKTVKVQQRSGDGVYWFRGFRRVPFETFRESLTGAGDLYLSADPILLKGGVGTPSGDFAGLVDDVSVPTYLPREDIALANLWIGAGENRSLLHYDPWDSFMVMVTGIKRFALFGGRETRNMYPYGVMDVKSLLSGRILDSKVNPQSIQDEYLPSLRRSKGVYGEISRGDILFIPAGFWHYVVSMELNIAVNFFMEVQSKKTLLETPLRQYVTKRYLTAPPVQTVGRASAIVRKLYRIGIGAETRAPRKN